MHKFEIACGVDVAPGLDTIKSVGIKPKPSEDALDELLNLPGVVALDIWDEGDENDDTEEMTEKSVEVVFGLDDSATPIKLLKSKVSTVIQEQIEGPVEFIHHDKVVAVTGLKSIFKHINQENTKVDQLAA